MGYIEEPYLSPKDLLDLPVGTYVRKTSWRKGLCAKKRLNTPTFAFIYYFEGNRGNIVSQSIMENGWFEECDKYGESLDSNKVNINSIKEEKEMSNVNYVGGEYKLAVVSYDLNSDNIEFNNYVFKCDIDLEIAKGDLLVAESSRGLGIVRVCDVKENNIKNHKLALQATAWIVDKIDMTKHKQKKEATERRKYLLKQLEEKKDQLETLKMYALLAEMDPEAKKLVDELKTLGM